MRRIIRNFVMTVLVLALLVVAGFIGSVQLICGDDEVARVTSPDGVIDAILMEGSCGATTSYVYRVYLVATGHKIHWPISRSMLSVHGAVRNESAYGINLRWVNANTLLAEYFDAKSAPPVAAAYTIGGRDIRVVPQPGIIDHSAPAGGMYYNLYEVGDK